MFSTQNLEEKEQNQANRRNYEHKTQINKIKNKT